MLLGRNHVRHANSSYFFSRPRLLPMNFHVSNTVEGVIRELAQASGRHHAEVTTELVLEGLRQARGGHWVPELPARCRMKHARVYLSVEDLLAVEGFGVEEQLGTALGVALITIALHVRGLIEAQPRQQPFAPMQQVYFRVSPAARTAMDALTNPVDGTTLSVVVRDLLREGLAHAEAGHWVPDIRHGATGKRMGVYLDAKTVAEVETYAESARLKQSRGVAALLGMALHERGLVNIDARPQSSRPQTKAFHDCQR